MTTAKDIVEAARTWLGVKWKHQGRTHAGIDCAGLVIIIGNNTFGLIDCDLSDYPRRPDGTFLGHFQHHLDVVALDDVQPGDVLLFNHHNHPCHCGIMVPKHGQSGLIHSHAKRRIVTHQTLEEAQSIVGRPLYAFRYPGLTEV